MSNNEAEVARHYSRTGLTETVLGIASANTGGKAPSYADLSAIDQFHTRGREATLELAHLAGLKPGMKILDVGCGLGGPARLIAAEFGPHVTGIDLSPEFIEAATALSAATNLAAQTSFQQGSALYLPFPDNAFDVTWTQHAAMNIADRPRLYRELFRVTKPGGILALHDIAAGPAGVPHYPVPWASSAAISYLLSPEQLKAELSAAGFHLRDFRDGTADAMQWFQAQAARIAQDGPPPMGPVLMGPDFREKIGNVARNLNEQRLCVVLAVAEKPA